MSARPRTVAVRFLDECSGGALHLDRLRQRPDFLRLTARDRRLATELVYGVLRNWLLLDYYLDCLSDRSPGRLETPVAWTLRVALYQIEFLRIPDRAAVHEAVEICRELRRKSAGSLVNAVLRRFLRERPRPPAGRTAGALSIRFSHPEWLVGRYLSRFGGEATETLLKRNNVPPLPLLWVNPFKIELAEFCHLLDRELIPHEIYSALPNCVVVRSPGFAEHQLCRQGFCFFMDPGSQEIPHLASLENCRRLGDFCGATGNKAFLLASRKPQNAHIYCSDSSFHRLAETSARMQRLNVPDMSLVQADLSRYPPFQSRFDFLLLDVPCSGVGTLRSNPDIRWKVREEDLGVFHDRQIRLLRNGFSALKRGGELIYSTCSTEPEENESVVEEFLEREEMAIRQGGYFRTFPEPHPGDCFFAARVRHQ